LHIPLSSLLPHCHALTHAGRWGGGICHEPTALRMGRQAPCLAPFLLKGGRFSPTTTTLLLHMPLAPANSAAKLLRLRCCRCATRGAQRGLACLPRRAAACPSCLCYKPSACLAPQLLPFLPILPRRVRTAWRTLNHAAMTQLASRLVAAPKLNLFILPDFPARGEAFSPRFRHRQHCGYIARQRRGWPFRAPSHSQRHLFLAYNAPNDSTCRLFVTDATQLFRASALDDSTLPLAGALPFWFFLSAMLRRDGRHHQPTHHKTAFVERRRDTRTWRATTTTIRLPDVGVNLVVRALLAALLASQLSMHRWSRAGRRAACGHKALSPTRAIYAQR